MVAGQELYYSTHQFFLSERSLFLLVTDVSKPLEFSRLDFWLESIRSRTKSAQVIIVGTHIDEKVRRHPAPLPFTRLTLRFGIGRQICTSEYLEAKEKEIRAKYLARYPNIHALCLIRYPDLSLSLSATAMARSLFFQSLCFDKVARTARTCRRCMPRSKRSSPRRSTSANSFLRAISSSSA